EMGAENVLVSMGGKGAILVTEGGCYKRGVAKGKVVNTVGAGDSMVAGFIYGYLKSGDYEYALKTGTAAGGATAFTVGIATRAEIEAVLNGLQD
ncbi:MAG: PfkB family carbohydrate kinase, partial [Acutalibacteraceae bacterium]